eukprot:497713-Rhodomonas_salina.1
MAQSQITGLKNNLKSDMHRAAPSSEFKAQGGVSGEEHTPAGQGACQTAARACAEGQGGQVRIGDTEAASVEVQGLHPRQPHQLL